MPRYTYKAKPEPNKTVSGYIEAESEQDAINKLTRMGHFPISVKYETLALEKKGGIAMRKIPKRDIAAFTRQLSTLIESGINILNAFNIISGQAINKNLGVILNDISGRIKEGSSLSESLELFPGVFSSMYCAMVRTGETSGDLKNTLKRLADYIEAEEEFRNSLRSAMVYPFFIFAVSALTVVVLLVFVIPRLVVMFRDMGQALPLPTRMLIGISDFLRDYWWIIIGGIFIIVFFLRRMYKSPKGRLSWDNFRLKAAFFGEVTLKAEVARLMRTLSLLLSSGITITTALDISASVLDNQVLKKEMLKFKEQISSGSSLYQAFKDSKLFPELVVNIISVGEETGALDKSLMNVAVDYEREVDRTLKDFIRLLEPVIILVMGLIVGFIVISMLLPIFQINLTVR